ncbi:MAG: PKD domain-containing protein, partial [Phycisphaerales bacterium]|nr:PKD domain-containing protein [Phycisphaerales bacterium]
TTIQGEVGLAVTITAPLDGASVFDGQSVDFTSSVINESDPVSYTWTSSLDGQLASGLGMSSFQTSSLSVGTHTITVLATDAASAADDDSIELTILPVPDLEIVSITPPSGAYMDEPTSFSFMVMNHGPADAPATTIDAYYSDTESIGGGDDTYIGTVAVPALVSGGSTQVTVDWTPATYGIYWIVGVVDPTDTIYEGNEGNNAALSADAFTIARRPDLQVSDITVSMCPTPQEGGQIEVSWTVSTSNGGPVSGTWSDQVAIAFPAGDPSRGIESIILGTFAGNGPGPYTRTETLTLPEGVDGDVNMILVTTDALNEINEGAGDDNNTLLDDQNLDLSGAGSLTLFCWTQQGPLGNGNWNVSGDGQSVVQTINGNPTYFVSDFNLNGASFQGSFRVGNDGDDDYIGFVFGFKGLGGVAAGEGYYLFSWKKGNQVSGGLGEAGFKVSKITGTSPDLWDLETQPGQMEVLARMDGDNAFGWQYNTDYNFFLSYQSNGNIRVIIRRASDGLELWNTGLLVDEDPLGIGRVGFYNFSQSQVTYAGFTSADLQPPVSDPGGPYVATAAASTVDIDASGSSDPDGLNGTIADIASFQWDVGDDGTGDDGGLVNVTESLALADLVARGLSLGSNLPLGLTVTDVDGLDDHASTVISYQSTAPTVDAGGPYSPVGPGGSVPLMGMVDDADLAIGVGDSLIFEWDTTPASNAGQVGDGFASVLDPVVSFDQLSSGNTLYLNAADASGLVTSTSVTIELVYPDLAVSGVTAPTSAPEGTDITVSWTVSNSGALDATGTWTDTVYLSEDAALDAGDIVVGSMDHTDLASGFAYNPSIAIDVPSDLAGMRYVIVATDSGDSVNEGPAENNNVASSVTPVDFFADCNGNGQPDFDDINTTFVSSDCNGNGVPDECELELVYSEDFEGTVGSEWSDTSRFDNSVPATFTRFSGRFSNIDAPSSQTLTLDTVAGVSYAVTFDLYIIDSWDGNAAPGPDYFIVDVNGGEVFRHTFSTFGGNQSYPEEPEFRANYGWASWADSIYRQVSVVFIASGASTTVTFRSENLQGLGDESWGIDNVRVLSEGSADCNGNGQLDSCDIAEGISADVNGNGIPDECEPHVDLRVASITAPSAGVAGSPATVSWEVFNDGPDDIDGAATWTDRVYLSDDAVLDGGDQVAADVVRSGPLADGASYTAMATITLPPAAGDTWVIVHSDYADVVEEFAQEANNAAADDAPVDVASPPDLVVTDITAPDSAGVGESIEISWTVRNDGDSPASGPWTDDVRLSADDQVGDDITFEVVSYTGTLEPGETYTQTFTIPLPAGEDGERYLVVEADSGDDVFEGSGESNNASVDDVAISISSPDLVVTVVTAPTDAVVGESVQVSWTVSNSGTQPVTGTWADRVSQSTDAAPGGDTALDTFFHTGTLAPGETYSETRFVTLAGNRAGAQYLVVTTDANGNVQEGSGEGNNATVSMAMTVAAPDLVVADIEAPSSATVGGNVSVMWTVRNDGDAPATGTWTDRLLLSADTTPGGDDVGIASFAFTGTLMPGETYQRTEIVALAPGASGDRYVVVRTDFNGQLDEGGADGNNALADDLPINISSPDLVVTAITVPASAGLGDSVEVSWTVMNAGNAAASGEWSDRVLQSSDASIGGDLTLANFTFTGTLMPGETYTQTEMVTLATSLSGSQRIVVAADVLNALDEGGQESNNSRISDGVIDVAAPDLVVTAIMGPATATVRDLIDIEWTVTNNGSQAASGSWSDQVALSTDAALGSDTVIGTFGFDGTLMPGETYTQMRSIVLPASAVNDRWLVIRADINNAVAEGSSEGNNGAVDDQPISISGPDLIVDAVDAPSSGTHGEQILVEWTVSNIGGDSTVGNWVDGIYL